MKTFQPSKKLQTIPEYIHARLAKEVKKVEEQTGRNVLNLGIGSPDVPPSQQYIYKLHEYIDSPNAHLYPGYNAIPVFAKALQEWYAKRFSVSLQTDELLPLLGGKDGLAHLPLALLDEGDEILVPDPGYPAFSEPALFTGAKPISYDLLEENNFTIDFIALGKKVTNKTRYIIVNFPSNPTGQVATLIELEKIVAFGRARNLFIIYDNAYSEITFGDFVAPSILQIPGAKDIAAEIGSFSKTFSLAGYRMGWIVGNKDIVAALGKVKSQMDSGMALPLQHLGAYVLTNTDKKWHADMLASYQERRDMLAIYLRKLGLTFTLPNAALYIWAKIPNSAENAEAFSMQILKEKQVLLTPGTGFGKNGERFVRVSYCANIEKLGEYF